MGFFGVVIFYSIITTIFAVIIDHLITTDHDIAQSSTEEDIY